jgi:hypothetical protein
MAARHLAVVAGVLFGLSGLAHDALSRDAKVRYAFRKAVPCPATGSANLARCPGWVVDHMIPLCAGGPDAVENMVWQELQHSRRKDRWERELCARMRAAGLPATLPQGD